MRNIMSIIRDCPDKDAFSWYAVYTSFRSEKLVANQLRKKNIEVYLPLVSKTKRYLRKLKTYQVPMIGCYLFVKIKRNQCISVLETERVVKIISERGQPSIIKEDEINVLKRIEGLEVGIENCGSNLIPGDKVAIRKGNLAGLKGRLIRQNGKKSFIVELESVGITLQLCIDTDMLLKTSSAKVLTA